MEPKEKATANRSAAPNRPSDEEGLYVRQVEDRSQPAEDVLAAQKQAGSTLQASPLFVP